MITLKVKQKRVGPVVGCHPWVFSQAFLSIPDGIQSGEPVVIRSEDGKFLALGYFSSYSQIAVRLWGYDESERVDEEFFVRRIEKAYTFRKRYVEKTGTNAYRLINGESDFLPGLIVDKYADTLVVQSLTAGIDGMLDMILHALREVYDPKTIVLRNDTASREIEGLAQEKRVVVGETSGIVIIEESGIRYQVDVLEGQKTGFFFDQRENRLAIKDLVKGRRTLDCFCYVGAWALSAAKYGATEVIGIDSSEKAVKLATGNADLNGLSARFVAGDVFEKLREFEKQKERFGCIILDPPAFVKSRAKVREALKGYKEINLRAMRLLEAGGVLVTCSCSHHIDQELFREMLIDAALSAGRQARLLEMRTQSRDHPMLLAAKETQYLKCAILIVD